MEMKKSYSEQEKNRHGTKGRVPVNSNEMGANPEHKEVLREIGNVQRHGTRTNLNTTCCSKIPRGNGVKGNLQKFKIYEDSNIKKKEGISKDYQNKSKQNLKSKTEKETKALAGATVATLPLEELLINDGNNKSTLQSSDNDKKVVPQRDDNDKKVVTQKDDNDKKVATQRDDNDKKVVTQKDDNDKKVVTQRDDNDKLPSSFTHQLNKVFEVFEYQRDILEYLRATEQQDVLNPTYMQKQTFINSQNRCVVVDWLVEVATEYQLENETLYLSISYMDRFLSQMIIKRDKLQLVATTAIFIAAKYEQIYPPAAEDLVYLTADTYTKKQMLHMEQIILKVLDFKLCKPTIFLFLRSYAAVCTSLPLKVQFLSQYICELSLLMDQPFLNFYPSKIAAAALALANYILDCNIWSSQLTEITNYRLKDLREVVLCLCKFHNDIRNLPQKIITLKYSAKKYKKIAEISPVVLDECLFDELLRKYNG